MKWLVTCHSIWRRVKAILNWSLSCSKTRLTFNAGLFALEWKCCGGGSWFSQAMKWFSQAMIPRTLKMRIKTSQAWHCNHYFRDRFGGSSLDDAVRHGHHAIQVISFITSFASCIIAYISDLWPCFLQRLLRENGAALDVNTSALRMCEAAARSEIFDFCIC